MIHGNSNDPVLIKRINLKIWSLRDEVESVVSKILRQNPDKEKLSPEELERIKEEYSYSGQVSQKPNLQLVEGGGEDSEGGDDLEAEMAAAMGGGDEESSEESSEESAEASGEDSEESGEEQSGDDLEAEMAAAMGGGEASQEGGETSSQEGKVKIIQRRSENIPESKISKGITFLGEVGMDTLYFFGSDKYLEGQSIVVEFQIPKRFVVNADIVYCRPFNIRSRIISENKLSYRVVAKFTFLKDGERTLLRQFINSIEPEVTHEPVAQTKEVKEEEGDDFDGLEGLDF